MIDTLPQTVDFVSESPAAGIFKIPKLVAKGLIFRGQWAAQARFCRGHYTTPTQTMHYLGESLKITLHLHCLIPSQMGLIELFFFQNHANCSTNFPSHEGKSTIFGTLLMELFLAVHAGQKKSKKRQSRWSSLKKKNSSTKFMGIWGQSPPMPPPPPRKQGLISRLLRQGQF